MEVVNYINLKQRTEISLSYEQNYRDIWQTPNGQSTKELKECGPRVKKIPFFSFLLHIRFQKH